MENQYKVIEITGQHAYWLNIARGKLKQSQKIENMEERVHRTWMPPTTSR